MKVQPFMSQRISRIYEHFNPSSTIIIAILWYPKYYVNNFRISSLAYSHPAIATSLYFGQNSLCLQRLQLPSSCQPITTVSAMFHYACIPKKKTCQLLAYSLFSDYWLATCSSTVISGRYLLHSALFIGYPLDCLHYIFVPQPNPVHSIPHARTSSESDTSLICSVPLSASAFPYTILYSGKYILNQRSILFWLLINYAYNRDLMFCSVLRSA